MRYLVLFGVLFLLVVAGVLSVLGLRGPGDIVDLSIEPPLPVSSDRKINQPLPGPDTEQSAQVSNSDVAEVFAPGGVYETMAWQTKLMLDLRSTLQVLPLYDSDYPAYLISESESYQTLMVFHDSRYVFDVLLKQEPLYESRMYAEASIAQAMGIERVDMCGFPAYVHMGEPHEFTEKENLGLAFCGADMLNMPE